MKLNNYPFYNNVNKEGIVLGAFLRKQCELPVHVLGDEVKEVYTMAREIAIGEQDFGKVRRENKFYVDKTMFIKEWWGKGDAVTLITRPRRFGKTFMMNTIDYFFSVEHKDDSRLFEGLKIWEDEKYRQIQGTYPVISLSFANVKEDNYSDMVKSIESLINIEFEDKRYLLKGDLLSDNEKKIFNSIGSGDEIVRLKLSINYLANFMSRYYGKSVIILLDEYDTPMHDAYLNGYWKEASQFFKGFFNSTFKTNPYMERGIITGITRISKESIFSDFNNLEVISLTSDRYTTSFGFTEDEVFAAMDEFGMDSKDEMKQWYDGFTFGKTKDIYNPWSVTKALNNNEYASYWVNSSSNSLMDSLIKEGNAQFKMQFEELLKGKSIKAYIDEEIVYNRLKSNKDALCSFMLAAGYLKVENVEVIGRLRKKLYTLTLPNMEVENMMNTLVGSWFRDEQVEVSYNGFLDALLSDDIDRMNIFMNRVAMKTFSYFDTGKKPSDEAEPERFYHGFVLGLIVDLEDTYEIKSNRESGFGRYDVMLKPLDLSDKAFIFEFKVKDIYDDESTLEDTVKNALAQIDEKRYAQELISLGIPSENIRKYGFAFEGKKVLIG
jgi:hypothetical protein